MNAAITFAPMGLRFEVQPGTSILAVARQHDIFLRHTCGGNAMCATCRCRVLSGAGGLSPMGRHEQRRLAEMYAGKDVRLACQAEILGEVVIEVSVPKLGL